MNPLKVLPGTSNIRQITNNLNGLLNSPVSEHQIPFWFVFHSTSLSTTQAKWIPVLCWLKPYFMWESWDSSCDLRWPSLKVPRKQARLKRPFLISYFNYLALILLSNQDPSFIWTVLPRWKRKSIENEVIKNTKLRFCFTFAMYFCLFYMPDWANINEIVKKNAPLGIHPSARNKHLSFTPA